MRRCPYCREPFQANPAVHVELPYLADVEAGDLTVWYCYEVGRHARVPLSWWVDLKRSIGSARALLRRWA